MSVLDTSAVVDFLLGPHPSPSAELIGDSAAPELLIFETLAVLRRDVLRETLTAERARGATDDLADLTVELFPLAPLAPRAWELRENFTVADAMFVALAEQLDEQLVTLDKALARSVARHTDVTAIIPA